jgi:hypothetical protein
MRIIAAVLLALAGASHAAVIAEARERDIVLQLTDEVGPCVGQAKLAVFRQGINAPIQGCYRLNPATLVVHIAFLDGDMAEVPVSLFKRPEHV